MNRNSVQFTEYLDINLCVQGHADSQSVESLRFNPESGSFDFRWESLEFIIDMILPTALRAGVD